MTNATLHLRAAADACSLFHRDGAASAPHVTGYAMTLNHESHAPRVRASTPRSRSSSASSSRRRPTSCWGLIPMETQALRPARPDARTAMYLLGADRLGRDMLSRVALRHPHLDVDRPRRRRRSASSSASCSAASPAISAAPSTPSSSASSSSCARCRRSRSGWASPPRCRRPGRRCRTYFVITIILSLIGWTDLARVVRGRFLALRERGLRHRRPARRREPSAASSSATWCRRSPATSSPR